MPDDVDEIHPLLHGAPKSPEFVKLRKRIVGQVREEVEQYGMIDRGAMAGLHVGRQRQLYVAGDPA